MWLDNLMFNMLLDDSQNENLTCAFPGRGRQKARMVTVRILQTAKKKRNKCPGYSQEPGLRAHTDLPLLGIYNGEVTLCLYGGTPGTPTTPYRPISSTGVICSDNVLDGIFF